MAQKSRGSSSGHLADVRPEYILLGFLAGHSMHGYDLHGQFQLHLGHVWHLSQSQMYSTIKRLEVQGLIEGLVDDGGAKPSRHCLSITPEGQRRYSTWLLEPSDCNSRIMRLEFISRLFFASTQNPAIVGAIVESQIASVRHELKNHERLLADLGTESLFNRLSLELRIRQLGAQHDWLVHNVTQGMASMDLPRG